MLLSISRWGKRQEGRCLFLSISKSDYFHILTLAYPRECSLFKPSLRELTRVCVLETSIMCEVAHIAAQALPVTYVHCL